MLLRPTLIICTCMIFISPSLGRAAVTLSSGDGLGVRASMCCNPKYPDSNRVELGLDNEDPDHNVIYLYVDICDVDDYLTLHHFELTPRTESFNYSITDEDGCVKVLLNQGLLLPGTGPILILYFDVAQYAQECRDLNLNDVIILDDGLQTLDVTKDEGEFCFYNCGVDLHCDDGVYCNGEEYCFNRSWCVPGSGDPCILEDLICDEDNDKCLCDEHGDCNDGLYCNGEETCVGGECEGGTPPCSEDGDPCTDDCDEGSDTCSYECNAAGPWDACCQSPACTGEAICNEEVTLEIGDGSGNPGSTGNSIVVSLDNQYDRVKAVLVDICDVDDYLTCPGLWCSCTGRTTGFRCNVNEKENGCCSVSIADVYGGSTIAKGTGPILTLDLNVSYSAHYGQCRDLTIDSEYFTVLDADTQPLVAMPVDGEFCFGTCEFNYDCQDYNLCTDDICNDGVCEYSNNTGACDDGNVCTQDQCKNGECVGYDLCFPDDEDYCNGIEYCEGGSCDNTGDPCGELSCNETDDVCEGSDVTLIIENSYTNPGDTGVINIFCLLYTSPSPGD